MAAQIDLDNLSDDDLQKLRSEIVMKVAERLKLDPGANLMYDRHGSGHSNSTSALRDVDILVRDIDIRRNPASFRGSGR